MCRLFGQISLHPESAAHGLVEAPSSLLTLSNADPRRLQKDGWGIAYYTGGGPVVRKSPMPAFKEKALFTRVADGIRSRIVIGHIRAASNPKGLPTRMLIRRVNSQPFSCGTIAFAHNGTLEIPDEVERFLGPYRKKIQGVNDSEVYFWQFMKFLDTYGSVPEALKACVREIWGIWKGCRSRYPKKKRPYTGLNALVSDGKSLHALCHYPIKNYPVKNMKGLLNPDQPWGRMSLSLRGGRALIASENIDRQSWRRLSDAEVVSVELSNGKLRLKRTPLEGD